jgi:hypothetical protein
MKLKEAVIKKFLITEADFSFSAPELKKMTGTQARELPKSVSQSYALAFDHLVNMEHNNFNEFLSFIKTERAKYKAKGHIEKIVAAYLLPLEEITFKKMIDTITKERSKKMLPTLQKNQPTPTVSKTEPTKAQFNL